MTHPSLFDQRALLDWQALRDRANTDGEFRLHARFWNARLRVVCDTVATGIEIRDGAVAAIEPWNPAWFGADIVIRADMAEWRKLLAPLPQPFYHDLWAANAHHGFSLNGTTQHLCAYYPALRRLVELMRHVHCSADVDPDPAPKPGANVSGGV
jgi:hypothetical protein